MDTTAAMEYSRGVAWTADVRRHGVKVGIIEQVGDGGADRVYVDRGPLHAEWRAAVKAALAMSGGECDGVVLPPAARCAGRRD